MVETQSRSRYLLEVDIPHVLAPKWYFYKKGNKYRLQFFISKKKFNILFGLSDLIKRQKYYLQVGERMPEKQTKELKKILKYLDKLSKKSFPKPDKVLDILNSSCVFIPQEEIDDLVNLFSSGVEYGYSNSSPIKNIYELFTLKCEGKDYLILEALRKQNWYYYRGHDAYQIVGLIDNLKISITKKNQLITFNLQNAKKRYAVIIKDRAVFKIERRIKKLEYFKWNYLDVYRELGLS